MGEYCIKSLSKACFTNLKKIYLNLDNNTNIIEIIHIQKKLKIANLKECVTDRVS
jgi:hypothetical protein